MLLENGNEFKKEQDATKILWKSMAFPKRIALESMHFKSYGLASKAANALDISVSMGPARLQPLNASPVFRIHLRALQSLQVTTFKTMYTWQGDQHDRYTTAVLLKQATFRKRAGYCPQFDALFDLLTVEEHLKYASSV